MGKGRAGPPRFQADIEKLFAAAQAGKAFCLHLTGSNGASVPVEHLVALVGALRDHLLACAPEALPEGTPGRLVNTTRNGKRKKKGDPQPQSSGNQVCCTYSSTRGLLLQDELQEKVASFSPCLSCYLPVRALSIAFSSSINSAQLYPANT